MIQGKAVVSSTTLYSRWGLLKPASFHNVRCLLGVGTKAGICDCNSQAWMGKEMYAAGVFPYCNL